jgi:threonine/homoserine/homoserine lactone efflux protein
MEGVAGFCAAVLALLLVPGPTNTLLATAGATVGPSRALYLLIWEIAGYDTAIAILRFVVVPLLGRLPAEAQLLRGAAAAYLLGLAVVMWRAPLRIAAKPVRARHVFVTTLLNPKAMVIGLVLFPATLQAFPARLAMLTAMLPVMGTLWICAGGVIGRFAPGRLVPKSASIALGVFAALLIASLVRV